MNNPNPGSKEAQEQGCICPTVDNHYGAGIETKNGIVFWYTENCPVHTEKSRDYELPKDYELLK